MGVGLDKALTVRTRCTAAIDIFRIAAALFLTVAGAQAQDIYIAETTFGPRYLTPGASLSHSVRVSNRTPQIPATNVEFRAEVPPQLGFLSISPSGYSCSTPAVGESGTIRCTRPSQANQYVDMRIAYRLREGVQPGTNIPLVVGTSASNDTDPMNNEASETVLVQNAEARADFALLLRSLEVVPGVVEEVRYEVEVRNLSAAVGGDARVLIYTGQYSGSQVVAPDGWRCRLNYGPITIPLPPYTECRIGAIGSEVHHFQVRYLRHSTYFSSGIEVSSGTTDPDLRNNRLDISAAIAAGAVTPITVPTVSTLAGWMLIAAVAMIGLFAVRRSVY